MARTLGKQISRKSKTAVPDAPTVTDVQVLLEKFGRQVSNEDVKISISDYIRLVQMQRELESTQAKDIEVSWVDNLDETQGSDA